MNATLIVNARIVTEGREFDRDLRTKDGPIERIGNGPTACPGEHLMTAAGQRLQFER